MVLLDIALPGILLLTKFFVKLVIDKTATLPEFISATLALPVDIVFLAASLFAGYAIAAPSKDGTTMFAGCLFLSLFIVFLWRRSESQFMKDRYWRVVCLGTLNIALSASMLIVALNLLASGAGE